MAHTRTAILNNFPPIVELDSERSPSGINILAVQKLVDGWYGDVGLYAAYSNVLKWGMFGGVIPSINL